MPLLALAIVAFSVVVGGVVALAGNLLDGGESRHPSVSPAASSISLYLQLPAALSGGMKPDELLSAVTVNALGSSQHRRWTIDLPARHGYQVVSPLLGDGTFRVVRVGKVCASEYVVHLEGAVQGHHVEIVLEGVAGPAVAAGELLAADAPLGMRPQDSAPGCPQSLRLTVGTDGSARLWKDVKLKEPTSFEPHKAVLRVVWPAPVAGTRV